MSSHVDVEPWQLSNTHRTARCNTKRSPDETFPRLPYKHFLDPMRSHVCPNQMNPHRVHASVESLEVDEANGANHTAGSIPSSPMLRRFLRCLASFARLGGLTAGTPPSQRKAGQGVRELGVRELDVVSARLHRERLRGVAGRRKRRHRIMEVFVMVTLEG
jgi:hypothetical protein